MKILLITIVSFNVYAKREVGRYKTNPYTYPGVNDYSKLNTFNQNFKLEDSNGNFRGNFNNNKYDPDSISNPYGKYGNKYSPDSINNQYGTGSKYNIDSPSNPYGQWLKIIED